MGTYTNGAHLLFHFTPERRNMFYHAYHAMAVVSAWSQEDASFVATFMARERYCDLLQY